MKELRSFFDTIYVLGEEEWKVFSSLFSEVELKKGEYFAQEGIAEKNIGLLTDGVARAFFRSNDGYEYNKKFFLPPEVIAAYGSLISGQPARVSVQALTDCRILVADFYSIMDLYNDYQMIERMIRIFSERLYLVKEKREIEMATLNADERYKIFLGEYPTLENFIPQYHIASYLGISPTQLSRIRSKKG